MTELKFKGLRETLISEIIRIVVVVFGKDLQDEAAYSKEKAIEKLKEILDRDDLCPRYKIRRKVIEDAISELEKPEGNNPYS